jgi:hypothetical protein
MSSSDQSEVRNLIMDDGVQIEFIMALFLAQQLKIPYKNKENKTLPLRYIQFIDKARILYEMEVISKKQFSEVQYFLEIRNAFAHNVLMTSFSDYFGTNKDKEKKLVELYENRVRADLERESYLQELYFCLVGHVKMIDLL